MEENTQKALASLKQRTANSTIALAADLANDRPDSICRLALAWIASGEIHGISYYIKPPTGPLEARTIPKEKLTNCKSFATVWDEEVQPLLKGTVLSAYRSKELFLQISASYAASGRKLHLPDVYIRDLHFLASTYLPNLANDTLPTILHRMNIPVDLDNALSRAMACIAGLNWLENRFPITSYGIPLTTILAETLTKDEEKKKETATKQKTLTKKQNRYARLIHYSRLGLLPFLILCLFLSLHYIHREQALTEGEVNFSQYSPTAKPEENTAAKQKPVIHTKNTHYLMFRGTYFISEKANLPSFIQASKNKDTEALRKFVHSHKVIVFSQPTRVKITGEKDENNFVPIEILDGDYQGRSGYAPYEMVIK